MALIACPECRAEVSERAPICPRCGSPVAVESVLIVTAPAQTMIASPLVSVEWQGRKVARLGKGQSVTVPIGADGVARFAASGRRAEVLVSAGRVTRVALSWSRLSGRLVAELV